MTLQHRGSLAYFGILPIDLQLTDNLFGYTKLNM